MSRSMTRLAPAPLRPRGRMHRPFYVFLMSGLAASVLGAAFWPQEAVSRSMAVRMPFDESADAAARSERIASLEATVADSTSAARWAAEADAKESPKVAALQRLAAFAPPPVRAESTLRVVPVEEAGRVVAVEIRFADSDALRAERFAQVLSRQFGAPSPVADADPVVEASAEDAAARTKARLAAREETLRRKRDELSASIGRHFAALRSLRAKVAPDESEEVEVSAPPATERSSSLPRLPNELKGVLWQVSPSESSDDIQLRLEALDRDIAAKETAREEILQKFTSQHPVAVALEVALERLKRERREIDALRRRFNAPAVEPSPPPAYVPPALEPTIPASEVTPPTPPAPAKVEETAPVESAPLATESPAEPTAPIASVESGERIRAVMAALDEALRSEEDLAVEIEALTAASAKFAEESRGPIATSPENTESAALVPSRVTVETIDAGSRELIGPRYAMLGGFALLFATTMTLLVALLGRERPVASADEVARASGMSVIGQSEAGLLDRKPRRNWSLGLVTGGLRLVEGATLLTALACVVALAAENPRCEWIVRQPLAAFWQAMQSVL